MSPGVPWLIGWKAVSAYIGKSVKTCQKYARTYSMPVHRDPGGGVLALPHELDRWVLAYNDLAKKRGLRIIRESNLREFLGKS